MTPKSSTKLQDGTIHVVGRLPGILHLVYGLAIIAMVAAIVAGEIR